MNLDPRGKKGLLALLALLLPRDDMEGGRWSAAFIKYLVRNERGLHIQRDSSHWRLPVMGRESGNPAGEMEAPAGLSGAAVSNADRQSRSTLCATT